MREKDVHDAPVVYLSPREFDLVERLTLCHATVEGSDDIRLDVELVLRPYSGGPDTRLTLRFGDVQSLKFLQPWGPQISPVEVRSMEHWQWEGLAYRVGDIEDENFMFWCSTFDATTSDDG